MLGIMFESHGKEGIPLSSWMIWLFSPIILPIIAGMMLVEKRESNE
jgi:hypothetical protein